MAIKIPEYISGKLYFNSEGSLKVVDKDKLHITLHFFEDEDPDKIIKALDKFNFDPFTVRITKIRLFPSKKPRLVAAFPEENERLKLLHRGLMKTLKINKKKLKPHITLARIKKLDHFEPRDLDIEFSVDRIYLIGSTLTEQGPVYEDLAVFPKRFKKEG
ncbi:MAG: RNA 2',3'-cyclic phosphodiesterase [Nanobdellota archaeon]